MNGGRERAEQSPTRRFFMGSSGFTLLIALRTIKIHFKLPSISLSKERTIVFLSSPATDADSKHPYGSNLDPRVT